MPSVKSWIATPATDLAVRRRLAEKRSFSPERLVVVVEDRDVPVAEVAVRAHVVAMRPGSKPSK